MAFRQLVIILTFVYKYWFKALHLYTQRERTLSLNTSIFLRFLLIKSNVSLLSLGLLVLIYFVSIFLNKITKLIGCCYRLLFPAFIVNTGCVSPAQLHTVLARLSRLQAQLPCKWRQELRLAVLCLRALQITYRKQIEFVERLFSNSCDFAMNLLERRSCTLKHSVKDRHGRSVVCDKSIIFAPHSCM